MEIDSIEELRRVLKIERKLYFKSENIKCSQFLKIVLEHHPIEQIWRVQKWMRICEYVFALPHNKMNHLLLHLCKRRLHLLSEKQNIEIYPGVFDEGLIIYHRNIVVNSHVKVGKNCQLHGNNCIGNKGQTNQSVPTIGNNVDIGFGAVVLGGIFLGDYTVIGANALVNHSFDQAGIIVGVPGKLVKSLS